MTCQYCFNTAGQRSEQINCTKISGLYLVFVNKKYLIYTLCYRWKSEVNIYSNQTIYKYNEQMDSEISVLATILGGNVKNIFHDDLVFKFKCHL